MDKNLLIMEKRCLECQEKITGRSDKKFCSDYCRNAYHNKKCSDSNKLMKRINNTLRKNRRILFELMEEGKVSISRSLLLEKGFNFRYHTNTIISEEGRTYYFCYEYGILKLNEHRIALVKKGK